MNLKKREKLRNFMFEELSGGLKANPWTGLRKDLELKRKRFLVL
jgi:hypothetical protein